MLSVFAKRGFSLYSYRAATNSKVFFQVSKNGQTLGDLEFELYNNRSPALVEHFTEYVAGTNENGASLEGTSLSGFQGFAVTGGEIANDGTPKQPDENLDTRHFKRGMLTLRNSGDNSNSSRFMITLDRTENLNGYNNAIGELVSGDEVLKEIEQNLTRHGNAKEELIISACGKR